ALAFTLFAAAALLVTSLERLQRVNPGFDPSQVLTMELFVVTPQGVEPTPTRIRGLFEPTLQRIRRLPGVESAGLINMLPTTGAPSTDFDVEGRSPTAEAPVAD